MPVYSFDEAPAEVRELLARSRSERRDPGEVCGELARLGVTAPMRVMYIRDGLGLSLEQAKRVVMSGSGSDDVWVEEVDRAVHEAVLDDAVPKEE
jgi:hypothetical protein